MIRLEVESYCQDCPYFQPHVHKPEWFYADSEPYYFGDTIVTCKNKTQCQHAVEHLEKHKD